MRSRITPAALTLVTSLLVGCLASRIATPPKALQPNDLTPVTWLEAPRHAPVEIVRDGKAGAAVYVADPDGRKD